MSFTKTHFTAAIAGILLLYACNATDDNQYVIRSGLPHPIYGNTTIYYPPQLFTTEEFRNTPNGFRAASAAEPMGWDKVLVEIDRAFIELSQCLAGLPEFEFGKLVVRPYPITQDELELLRHYPIVLRLIPFIVENKRAAGALWPNSHIEVGINTFPAEFRNDLKHEWLHLILDVRLGRLYGMETLGPFAHHQVPMKKCAPDIDTNERKSQQVKINE